MSRFASGLHAFFDELKRRHVFRVAAAYVVGAFFVLQAADLIFQGLPVPAWVYPTLTVLTLIGFPIVLVLAWAFQWTAQGIRREDPTPALAEAVAVSGDATRGRANVRAFAFVGLGVVIALAGTGLSLPLMYSDRNESSLEGQREGVVPAANTGGIATLAVLPFASLTGGNDDGFADGLAEDITAALAQLGSVDVISRTSSEAYRDSDKTARVIGAELGVGLILEGTIRRAGDRVRVTVQLIDATTDRHLWANSYDRDLTGDVFGTQSQLAQEIVAAIQSVVMPEQADQAENRLLALGYSEQGNELLSRAEPAYDQAARQVFEDALEADPENPVAHAGVAQTLVTQARAGSPELLDSAAVHAARAVRLNPRSPDAHAARAFVFLAQGDLDSMQVALRRAVELDETGEKFEVQWMERIRMISPEALETAQRAIAEIHVGASRFEFHSVPETAETPRVGGRATAPRQ